ncbi:MAG: ribosomal-processing cysteine protease Prp [Clostridia bacterium]|nr:ribosomal-processing cysteine protease Prp [Clostridia bacterium]MEE1116430.1 ribosomal-processing cysteine protease Prp [Clostridia bacterium]
MTKIVFFRSGGVFYGFKEQGHTGYGESGDDILCAALSSMTMLIINSIELGFMSEVDYDIDEETTDVKVKVKAALPEFEGDERKRFAASGLIMGYYYQLNDLTEEYYDYLSVDVIDLPYEEA